MIDGKFNTHPGARIEYVSDQNFNPNCAIIEGDKANLLLESLGDRVIVREDKHKTGYECSTCDGESYLDEPCDFCKGSGRENAGTDNEAMCRMCCPPNLAAVLETRPGKKICPNCNGRGSIIVAPQTSQKRPTTGVVLSSGPEVKILKNGDHILYSMFAGTAINFKQKIVIRIMYEHEVYARIFGLVGKFGDWTR